MSKNKEREGRNSKGQRKEGKPVKVNSAQGKGNKFVDDEKAGKQDDASKKFPNFSLLSEEERQVFFEALTTARKNLEKKGVPIRQRFGTVHDEYLNHFERNVKTEQEGDSEKSAPSDPNSVLENKVSPFRDGSTTFVPQEGDPSQKKMDRPKTSPTFCAQLSLSERANPEVLEQCESVIRQNTNRILDLYVKRKKKNEGKLEIPVPEKGGRPEKEKGQQAEENAQKLSAVGKPLKTRNTPRFDALSPEEKEVFFKILNEARNNVVEKNPGKKNEILPLDSIARMYQGCRRTTNVFVASKKAHKLEHEKKLKVKVTLTSGDDRRTEKWEEKVEEKKSEGSTKDVEGDKREEVYLKPDDKFTKESSVEECDDSSKAPEGEKASKYFNGEEAEASEKELKPSKEKEESKEKGGDSKESKTEISSKQREGESAERSGNEKLKEDEMENSTYDEKSSEKVRNSSSRVAREESEGAQEIAKTSTTSAFPQDREECQEEPSSSKTESQKTESEKWKTFSTPKVMFVEDNVIEKIRNLIFYLEAKARKNDCLEKEYMKLLVDYVDYLSRVLEALVLKKSSKQFQAPFQLENTYIDAEVHLKFNDDHATQKVPRSVSGHNIGGTFLAGLSEENITEKVAEAESKIDVTLSHSETSVTSVNSEEATFLPPETQNKKVGLTKIRLLQDLLKKRAEFVEGSTEDLKIVHHPEEEYIPAERPETTKTITSESEEHAHKDQRVKFLKLITKCFTCGKKQEDEYGVFENLKGEAVKVVVSEGKNTDPANATLNQSVLEVLKAAGRQKIIEKFYGKT